MQIVYKYLISSLLPANLEIELQGGSIPRHSPSLFSAHGRFITGPSNLKQAKTVGKIPKVYLFNDDLSCKQYYLVVYRVLSATLCLFIDGEYNWCPGRSCDIHLCLRLFLLFSILFW